jgi:hypothetical protein
MGVLLALLAAAAADAPTICADRPGKASQTCTVPKGHFQIEADFADWTLTRSPGERDTALTAGDFALKYGLSSRSHIEVDVTPWKRVTSHSGHAHDRASGFGDLLVVYKQLLTPADAAVQVAVSPFVKAPTARRALGNRKWEGGLVVPLQYAIPRSTLALSMTPEIDWVADADGRGHHVAGANVVNLGWQANSRLNLSAEIWSQWDWDPAGTTRQASADGAVAYLARRDLQLDSGFNIGLNRATPDLELYAGASILF